MDPRTTPAAGPEQPELGYQLYREGPRSLPLGLHLGSWYRVLLELSLHNGADSYTTYSCSRLSALGFIVRLSSIRLRSVVFVRIGASERERRQPRQCALYHAGSGWIGASTLYRHTHNSNLASRWDIPVVKSL